jgi:hypothetical protein
MWLTPSRMWLVRSLCIVHLIRSLRRPCCCNVHCRSNHVQWRDSVPFERIRRWNNRSGEPVTCLAGKTLLHHASGHRLHAPGDSRTARPFLLVGCSRRVSRILLRLWARRSWDHGYCLPSIEGTPQRPASRLATGLLLLRASNRGPDQRRVHPSGVPCACVWPVPRGCLGAIYDGPVRLISPLPRRL